MTRWTSPGYSEVAELVRERTGLVFPEARVTDVEATIRRAMARRGIDELPRLTRLLRDDEAAREAFVAELTIGESYFQRDPAQFELLRELVLPALLSARPADRPIRVWSAGCASGEEPYTIAMIFDELKALDRCDIVGTDIARGRLEHAQRGLYSEWSLRNSDQDVRSRYFTERGRYHALKRPIRERVDFRYLNLAEDLYPSLSTGIWGMDVILCRNVLIYFDAPTVERVARRLLASLSEDGWLLLGASDPAIGELVECDVVLTAAGLAYRRPGTAGARDLRPGRAVDLPPVDVDPGVEPDAEADLGANLGAEARVEPEREAPTPAEAEAAAFADPHEAAGEGVQVAAEEDAGHGDTTSAGAAAIPDDEAIADAYAARDFDTVVALASAAAEQGTIGLQGWTAWLRALANQGCLDEAARIATRALDVHRSSAELLYLHAVLLLQGGLVAEAGAAARRALYLDRRLVVAHLTLAEAHRKAGSHDAARRALRNAGALLRDMPADAYVPASDGETAGRLAELVRVKERLLEESS